MRSSGGSRNGGETPAAPRRRRSRTAAVAEPSVGFGARLPAHTKKVIAPLTGVFYRSSSPDAEAFVSVGDRIEAGDVLCILEAMKLFNEIQSDYDGTVTCESLRKTASSFRKVRNSFGSSRNGMRMTRPMTDVMGKRGFDELLADRRGLLDAPHYRVQVEAIAARSFPRYAPVRRYCGAETAAARRRRSTWRRKFRDRFLRERPGLHSEALSVNSSTLTSIGNDYGYERVFSRQVEAFVQPGDVVIGMTTSGTSRNIVRALEAAKERGALAVAFSGNGGGEAAEVADLALVGPDGYAAIVQEVHQVMAHIVCDFVEQRLIFEDGIADAGAHAARRALGFRANARSRKFWLSAT